MCCWWHYTDSSYLKLNYTKISLDYLIMKRAVPSGTPVDVWPAATKWSQCAQDQSSKGASVSQSDCCSHGDWKSYYYLQGCSLKIEKTWIVFAHLFLKTHCLLIWQAGMYSVALTGLMRCRCGDRNEGQVCKVRWACEAGNSRAERLLRLLPSVFSEDAHFTH